jgi:spermidine/putrescine transport system substrate-binding protein
MLIQSLRPLPNQRCWLLGFLIFSLLLTGCSPLPVSEPPAQEIILYDWDGDIPPSVLEAFTKETNIKVNYQVYASQEEAIANLRSGQAYDVAVIESRFVSLLVNEGLLADLDYKNITNFKNISPNFRSLAYDPDNRYSVPYSWGTTGLLARTDLTPTAITRWSDLWDARYAHKVAIWKGQPRETLALTLKSLGYPRIPRTRPSWKPPWRAW